MSDAVRVYGGMKRSSKRARGPRRAGPILLALVLLAAAWIMWTTRDTHEVHALVPANRAYHVVAKDVFARRLRLAESQVWNALPPQLGADEIPAKLSQDVGVPQWILNNLVPGACYVAGNDVKTFSDALVVTRMTRVGVLLERLRGFFTAIEEDPAGGLELRRMGGVYYGIRGRVLLLSMSRRGLIEALTLLPDDALGSDELEAMTDALGEDDIYGRFQLAADDPLGDVAERGTFSLRVDKTGAAIRCSAELRPDWRDRMAGVLDGVKPQTLQTPPDGLLRLSLNLGKPVEALWHTAGAAMGKQEQATQLWAKWTAPPEDGEAGLSQAIVGLVGGLGPGVRLSLTGVDLNEIVPAPLLVAVADANAGLAEAFKQLPPPPDGTQPWETWPRYDEQAGVVRVPLIGGPSLEPTAGIRGGDLVMSSSRLVAETLMADPAAADAPPLPEPANIYAQIKPREFGQAAFDTAMVLAEAGLLRGHSPQTLQETYAPWLEKAAAVREVSATAAYDSGTVTLDVSMVCAQ